MRNTFVKLFLALAVCFMIGSALVACGGSFELTVSDDGYFVVNGEKTDIKQGDSVEDCAHEVQKFEVKAHTADADGVVLEVCTKCDDYAKVTAGTIHDYVEDEIAATCTAAGFKGEICSICGNHGEGADVDAAGHKWSDDIILTNNVDACTEGGVAVQHCSVCKFVSEPAAVEPVGHVVKNWTVSYPTEARVGLASGRCIYCGDACDYELPALNDEDYTTSWKDGKVPTCYEEGTKLYTYVVKNEQNNKEDAVWDKNISFTAPGVTDTADHVVGGKAYTEWYNKDKDAYNYYDDVDGDGDVEAVGFRETAIAGGGIKVIDCGTKDSAYFVCEACNYAVVTDENGDDIQVYKDHFGAETIIKAASCNTAGQKKIACMNCLDMYPDGVTVDYTVDHNIEYVAEYDVVNKYWVVYGKCNNLKLVKEATATTKAEYIKCYEQAATVGELRGYEEYVNVPAEKIDTVKSTCYMEGYDVMRCEVSIGKKTIAVDAKKMLGKDDMPDHTLNGKLFSDYDKVDTTTKGILPVNGGKFEVCGTMYDACYVCDVCAAYSASSGVSIGTLVVLKGVDQVEMPHSYVEVESDDAKAATCLVAGKEFVKCVNTACGKYDQVEEQEIKPLGHDYKVTYEINLDKNQVLVKATCSRACKESFASVEGIQSLAVLESYCGNKSFDMKDKTKTKATCSSDEIVTYTGTLAVAVVDQDGDVLGTVDKDGKALFDFVKDEDGKYIHSLKIEVAEKKEKGAGYEQDADLHDFVNIAYEKNKYVYVAHDWCDVEAREVTVFNRDWDKDGVIDAIETYTFEYCVECYEYRQVGSPEVEQLTDVTEAPDEEEE